MPVLDGPMTMPVLDGPMTMPVLDGVKPMAITLPICGTSESLFWKRKKSIYCWTRSRPTWTFGESDDQVRDKSESKYQRVQDKSETIEKRLESGLESETGLEYYSPSPWLGCLFLWICYLFLCGSVVEHCVSSAKGCGFDSQGTHIIMKMYNLNAIVSRFG